MILHSVALHKGWHSMSSSGAVNAQAGASLDWAAVSFQGNQTTVHGSNWLHSKARCAVATVALELVVQRSCVSLVVAGCAAGSRIP